MEIKEAFLGKEKQWAKVIAQAWADDGFKKRFLDDPRTVLMENGIEFPENIKLGIAEGKEDEVTLILPPKPTDLGTVEELSERAAAFFVFCG